MYELHTARRTLMSFQAHDWILCLALGVIMQITGKLSHSIIQRASAATDFRSTHIKVISHSDPWVAYTSRYLRINEYLLNGTNSITAIA